MSNPYALYYQYCTQQLSTQQLVSGTRNVCSVFTFNLFRTAVPLEGQTTQSRSSLSPKRDCDSERVVTPLEPRRSDQNTDTLGVSSSRHLLQQYGKDHVAAVPYARYTTPCVVTRTTRTPIRAQSTPNHAAAVAVIVFFFSSFFFSLSSPKGIKYVQYCRIFYPNSVHSASVLVPYRREIRRLWSQTAVRQKKKQDSRLLCSPRRDGSPNFS